MDNIQYNNNDIPENIRRSFSIPYDENYTVDTYPPAGIIQVRVNGQSGNDFGPSTYSAFKGCMYWEKNGVYHREGGPAIIDYPKGLLQWYAGGILIREEEIGREPAHNMIKEILNKGDKNENTN